MKKIKEEGKIKVKKLIDLINEVDKEPEPKLLWKGIPEGSHGLIVGHAKAGKTTFAENLAMAISIGSKQYFGYELDGDPKKVLFINIEEPYRLRARRNKKQISEMNEKELELFSKNFDTTNKDFLEFINDEEDWKNLSTYIESSDAEIVFIDSLTNMFKGKIEDSSAGRNFIELFSKYLKKLNKTYIIIHHTTKTNDKPLEPNNVAGSRVILQYFEFIYGMSEVPSEMGGNYFCDVQNKYFEKDSQMARMYKFNENGWIDFVECKNKYHLYDERKSKSDGRIDNTNQDLLYDYILNQYNMGNMTVSTSAMMHDLVYPIDSTMSHDTFHKSRNKLIKSNQIKKIGRGVFELVEDKLLKNE